ncbi:hypothetical protein [Phyllobacterium endophyticum]|nr:hypothetical protein [Phyllobacterium endophyticum]MBB3235655.1 dienelactone hydrolase [Phyllobacterium endophyticum]TYR41873.1 hypothetical protein FY050_11495 [Phyllobacterium endophyticum]
MIKWMDAGAARVCLLGMALALSMACSTDSKAQSIPLEEGIFSGQLHLEQARIDDTAVPNEPVIGKVKIITDPEPSQEGDVFDEPVTTRTLDVPKPDAAARFLETAPDVTSAAKYSSTQTYEYDLGNLVATASADGIDFTEAAALIAPIKGVIRFPDELSKDKIKITYPVILFLHGRSPVPDSYKGYDYLAKDLAKHGYVVVSIDAASVNNEMVTFKRPDEADIASFPPKTLQRLLPGVDINSPPPGKARIKWLLGLIRAKYASGDASSLARGQLILGTLDRLRQINQQGQKTKAGAAGPLNVLKGKLDFTRIGIMGHSRGGHGVVNALRLKDERLKTTANSLAESIRKKPDLFENYPLLVAATQGTADLAVITGSDKFKKALKAHNIFLATGSKGDGKSELYGFKGGFLLAPTYAGSDEDKPKNVPLAVLLPGCDGDVVTFDGAKAFDKNRFGAKDDQAPRYQVLVQGANHNFYNAKWTSDDASNYLEGPDFCKSNAKGNVRLSADAQRNSGLFLIDSFMRYHVGREMQFASYWNAQARLPQAACPEGKGSCDERVVLTVQKGGSHSKTIQSFNPARDGSSFNRTVVLSGIHEHALCDLPVSKPPNPFAVTTCTPEQLPAFISAVGGAPRQGFLSVADHLELSWTKIDASIVKNLGDLSAKGYDSLTFRIAVARPMDQEVEVTLTDTANQSYPITASNFSDALHNLPRRKDVDVKIPVVDHPDDEVYTEGQARIFLNMVAIPLKAFEGVDLAHLKELKLAFPKESGSVAITDIELQNFGRDELIASKTGIGLASSKKPEDKVLLISQ